MRSAANIAWAVQFAAGSNPSRIASATLTCRNYGAPRSLIAVSHRGPAAGFRGKPRCCWLPLIPWKPEMRFNRRLRERRWPVTVTGRACTKCTEDPVRKLLSELTSYVEFARTKSIDLCVAVFLFFGHGLLMITSGSQNIKSIKRRGS